MDRPVDVMRSLVLEMERVDHESRRLVEAMLGHGREVALLPELLR